MQLDQQDEANARKLGDVDTVGSRRKGGRRCGDDNAGAEMTTRVNRWLCPA